MKVRLGQRGWVIAASAAALVATAGIASGSIPGVGGVVSACYAKTTVGNNNTVGPPGSIHPIDKEAGKACTTKESALDLYTKQGADAAFLGKTAKAADADRLDGRDSTEFVGPAGPPGPAGAPGHSGLPEAFVTRRITNQLQIKGDGVTRTTFLVLNLPPGQYMVSGKLQIHNSAPQSSFKAGCNLYPSKPDGTPGQPYSRESDATDIELGADDYHSGNQGQVALFIPVLLEQPGTVTLECRGWGQYPVWTSWVSINAIEVASARVEYT